jgi:hypothetical protein
MQITFKQPPLSTPSLRQAPVGGGVNSLIAFTPDTFSSKPPQDRSKYEWGADGTRPAKPISETVKEGSDGGGSPSQRQNASGSGQGGKKRRSNSSPEEETSE